MVLGWFLLNPHQSAYCKHHSTETALTYIHDHLINAIGAHVPLRNYSLTGAQEISCFCLFDLSAAFDTIDHDILITRLSPWFRIHGSVLNWFKSYLSSNLLPFLSFLSRVYMPPSCTSTEACLHAGPVRIPRGGGCIVLCGFHRCH